MPLVGPTGAIRPKSVSIFKSDPAGLGLAVAFLLQNTSIPSDESVRFDGTESEVETLRWEPTQERTVEAFATTAVRKMPESFTVSGILTATPPGLIGIALGSGSRFIRRDISAYRRLVAIADAREPVIVIAREAAYTSMLITSITRSKTPAHGDALRVAVGLVEVRIVSPATVIPLVDLEAFLGGASSSTDLGAQGTVGAADVAAGGFG